MLLRNFFDHCRRLTTRLTMCPPMRFGRAPILHDLGPPSTCGHPCALWHSERDSVFGGTQPEGSRFLSPTSRGTFMPEIPRINQVSTITQGPLAYLAAFHQRIVLRPLVQSLVESSGGEARGAFYASDGTALHHVIGTPDAYARLVDGFVISPKSLACGLAAAKRQPILTPDVADEPLWK